MNKFSVTADPNLLRNRCHWDGGDLRKNTPFGKLPVSARPTERITLTLDHSRIARRGIFCRSTQKGGLTAYCPNRSIKRLDQSQGREPTRYKVLIFSNFHFEILYLLPYAREEFAPPPPTLAKKMHSTPPVAIDLFAGGGGLSLGLKQAGFVVCAAVENNAKAAETYSANHRGSVVFQRDIKKVTGKELLAASPSGSIDLIAACPPCQGFSQLTAKYRRDDMRNQLIFEFVRLVSEIRPKTVMMENVPGLVKKGKPLFDAAMDELASLGYKLTSKVLEVADYGVPQRRSRLVVLGSLKEEIPLPSPSHSSKRAKGTKLWATVKDAIGNTREPLTLSQSNMVGGPRKANWHIVRDLQSANIERLKASIPGGSRADIPIHLRPPCHRTSDSGFTNVYGRMAWDEPSPTITGGCTSLSKGRFGHPAQLRTISVREAATLQSFPASYIIATLHVDDACKIIGNALPPRFAKVMAQSCMQSLKGSTNE